jgi:hypothetical protein
MANAELDIFLTCPSEVVLGYLVTDLEICRGLITVDVEKIFN